jgi:hypothetical protein
MEKSNVEKLHRATVHNLLSNSILIQFVIRTQLTNPEPEIFLAMCIKKNVVQVSKNNSVF